MKKLVSTLLAAGNDFYPLRLRRGRGYGRAAAADGADDAIQVGIIQLVENGAFADMREGFIAKMRELGYSEDKMVFDYKNANGDTATLTPSASPWWTRRKTSS
jgi:putative ABC transport system substrate-binding protein